MEPHQEGATLALRLVVVLTSAAMLVQGHGFLKFPLSRSYLGKFLKDSQCAAPERVKIFYSYTGLNCGGKTYQHERQGGKCGSCGDKYDQFPRNFEKGGAYYSDIIVNRYYAGCEMKTTIDLTAFHKGWVEFRLCHDVSGTEPATAAPSDLDSCFSDANRHRLLRSKDGTSRFTNVVPGVNNITLQLPVDITCDTCVLQWRYRAGNSWPFDGDQEEFYNCADIAVYRAGVTPDDSRLLNCGEKITLGELCPEAPVAGSTGPGATGAGGGDWGAEGAGATSGDSGASQGSATGCSGAAIGGGGGGPIVSEEEGTLICELLAGHVKHLLSFRKCCAPVCQGANQASCETQCLTGCPSECNCSFRFTCTK